MNFKQVRTKAGLSQAEFWQRIGITQSGGSRFESGRVPPKPVRMLASLAYGKEKERRAVMEQLGL